MMIGYGVLILFYHPTGMVGSTLARHRSKPRVYVGCMKSGPVLAQKYDCQFFFDYFC